MKKLIAISVVFALVAGAVFAAEVSGEVFGTVTPLQGDTAKAPAGQKGSGVKGTGDMKRIRVEVTGEDDNGLFGGYVRVDRSPWWRGEIQKEDWSGDSGDHLPGDLATVTGNVWWKPSEQFKFMIGGNGKDGFFGADGIMRWSFYQVAADGVGIAQEKWRYSSSFFGGFDPLYSAIFTITPTEAVEVNIGIPFWDWTENKDGQNNQTADKFKKTNFQFAYTIDGTGKFALTYKGDVMEKKDQPTVYGYFNLTAIENLGVDIGIGFKFPNKEPSTSNPIAAGVGVAYNAGEFGVKARVQGKFGGEKTDPLEIDFDVLPYYAISDTLTFFFDAGIYLAMPDKGDNTMGWHINPYITIKSSWWAPNFYAGIRIADMYAEKPGEVFKKKGVDDVINWSIPIGIAVHF